MSNRRDAPNSGVSQSSSVKSKQQRNFRVFFHKTIKSNYKVAVSFQLCQVTWDQLMWQLVTVPPKLVDAIGPLLRCAQDLISLFVCWST